MTNGDAIRAMTDEQIVEFFFGPEAYTISMAIPVTQVLENGMIVEHMTTKRFIDWMKEEVSNESNKS